MSNLALLAASRPTEVPKGPFVAFQQGKDALPDGRRVSNWYLLDDSGNSVCLALAAGSAADVPHAAYCGSGLGARVPPLAATRPKKWRHIYANFRLVLLSIYPRGTRNTCVRYMHSFDEALGVLRPTNGSQEHGGTRSEGLLLPRFQVLAVVGVESERRDAHYHYSAVSPRAALPLVRQAMWRPLHCRIRRAAAAAQQVLCQPLHEPFKQYLPP